MPEQCLLGSRQAVARSIPDWVRLAATLALPLLLRFLSWVSPPARLEVGNCATGFFRCLLEDSLKHLWNWYRF